MIRPHVRGVLDIFFCHLLYFLTVVDEDNKGENATAASGPEKQNDYK
jgi:hypothetical protein